MITLDGSTLEGGGQLVRVALSLSAIYRLPIRVSNVRANRAPKTSKRGAPTAGGLKESHLAALHWLADVCGAKTKGDEVGSEEFVFRPTPKKGLLPVPKESSIELKKPGSVWLVLQALLPFLVFATNVPVLELTIKGGTNVSKSMSGEYVQQVLIPILTRLGLPMIEVDIIKRGWASHASEIGEVKITVHAAPTQPFTLPPFKITDRGSLQKISISIIAHTTSTRALLTTSLRQSIHAHFGATTPIDVAITEESGSDSRLYILAVAHTSNNWRLGRDALYGRRISNEREARAVAKKSAEEVVAQLAAEMAQGSCVDEYLQDQLVVWQALAGGASVVDGGEHGGEGSLHTRTVRWVCEEMLGPEVSFQAGGCCRVRDRGVEAESAGDGVDGLSSGTKGAGIRA